MSKKIPAVGYLRASSDKQETSVHDQKKAVQDYADKHGYKIDEWYIDDGISGDEAKRPGFLKMIDDAKDGHFKAILVWDQDRFGRFDSMDAGYWTYPLRQAGVVLVTVNDGPIDWNDFTGRVIYGLKQEGKKQYLLDLSRNVCRGQFEAAKNGSPVGTSPYGYLIDGSKKKNKKLVVNETQAAVVRRIFQEYVEDARSMTEIAERLTTDKVPTRHGATKWHFDAVKTILENVAYVGTYRFNVESRAKYNHLRDGQIVPGKRSGRNPESDWIVHLNNHEPIIDQETFDRAQEKRAKGKTGISSRHSPETNPYVLSGVLRCGKCGEPMYGIVSGTNRFYECKNTKHGTCAGTTVNQSKILNVIADYLDNWLGPDAEYLGGAAHYGTLPADFKLPKAFEEIRELIMPPAKPKQDRTRLEKQVAKLKADLAKAKNNLVLLDAENIPFAQERIRQLEGQRTDLEAELAQCKPPPSAKDVNQIVLDVLNQMYAFSAMCRILASPVDKKKSRYSVAAVAPQGVRRLLKDIDKIVVNTTLNNGRGTGKRHQLKDGEIHFRRVGITRVSRTVVWPL